MECGGGLKGRAVHSRVLRGPDVPRQNSMEQSPMVNQKKGLCTHIYPLNCAQLVVLHARHRVVTWLMIMHNHQWLCIWLAVNGVPVVVQVVSGCIGSQGSDKCG